MLRMEKKYIQRIARSVATEASVADGSVGTVKLGQDITIAGKALLDDANATAQLVTLGAAASGHTHAQLHDAVTVTDSPTVDLSVTGQNVTAAVITQLSLTADASGVKLVGDSASPGNTQLYGTNGIGTKGWYAQPAGGGDVSGPASSVDGELPVYSGTGGKTLARATTTGVLKATSGVVAAAVAGTDYARPLTIVATLSGNQATGANVTPVTLTGLVFSYEANATYRLWFMGRVQPTAATTGCGFQFDLSSAVTGITVQFLHQLANTGSLSGGHSIADDASVGVSSGMPGTSTYPVMGFGLLVTGANTGTAQLRFRSETTAVTTCVAGFTLVVERVA